MSWVIKCPHWTSPNHEWYMVYNGYYFWWCPIFPKWDIYQPLNVYSKHLENSWKVSIEVRANLHEMSNHVDLLAIHLEIHLEVICIYIVSCRLFIVFPINQTIDPWDCIADADASAVGTRARWRFIVSSYLGWKTCGWIIRGKQPQSTQMVKIGILKLGMKYHSNYPIAASECLRIV